MSTSPRRTDRSLVAAIARIPFEFNLLRNLKRSYPLMMIGGFETGTPFVRMFALTHILSLLEVGFVSVLTAFTTFFELSTDIAMYRFVFSAPKQQYGEALAAAHALMVARGVVVSLLALAAAPLVAAALSLGDSWLSFAALAPAILLRSFENVAPRVAERDFRYWPQMKVTGISQSLSLVTLIIVAILTRSHNAIIAAAYVQACALIVLSHRNADSPYRLDFRGPLFKSAFLFGYPLVVNGLGLSIAMQGDRFIIAGLFDLETLALYSVITLAAVVPTMLLTRVLQSTFLARLFHAGANPERQACELRLASSVVAFLACFYAGGVVLLTNPLVVLVFGQKFHADYLAMILLGLGVFVRLVRTEPFTCLMLNTSRTKKLAASNISASSSLAFMVLFSFYDRSINGILAARLLGELTGLVVSYVLARRVPEGGEHVYSSSTLIGFLFAGVVCLASVAINAAGNALFLLLAAALAFAVVTLAWGVLDVHRRMKALRAINAADPVG